MNNLMIAAVSWKLEWRIIRHWFWYRIKLYYYQKLLCHLQSFIDTRFQVSISSGWKFQFRFPGRHTRGFWNDRKKVFLVCYLDSRTLVWLLWCMYPLWLERNARIFSSKAKGQLSLLKCYIQNAMRERISTWQNVENNQFNLVPKLHIFLREI